ncbi:DUF4167 domain-containing protein [Pseudoroseicyclus sp. H15]
MRSSKSRSRNKNRNNRPSGGNIVNRVFDSSGPDGKVRGTPQQIIDKYSQLHRDAHLSGDRVDAENYAQHAEHYLRMLAEAQREMEKSREKQEQEQRDRQAERDRERNDRLRNQENQSNGDENNSGKGQDGGNKGQDKGQDRGNEGNQPDSGLVETPEEAAEAAPKPRPRRRRAPKGDQQQADQPQGDSGTPAAAE